jgi:hypothetical protein
MQKPRKSKNIQKIDGVPHYRRWVVLGPEVATIDMIRKYAFRKGITIRRAFSEMIKKASHDEDKNS